MKIRFIARKFTLTDDVKERVQKKLQKLDEFFPPETEATVALYGEKIGERIEVTIYRGGTIFRAEESDKDVACALDTALDVIERQIRKNRTRLEKQIHITKEAFGDPTVAEPEEEIRISKTKRFEIRPMTVEEAIMQMNLLSHTFYLFRNSDTGELNVVYKRRENDYGLIEPIV